MDSNYFSTKLKQDLTASQLADTLEAGYSYENGLVTKERAHPTEAQPVAATQKTRDGPDKTL